MRMYSLYDCKSMQFTHPFGQINDNTAIRLVQNEILRKDTPVGLNPEDFTLYYVGEFDEHKGRYIEFDNPMVLKRCDQMIISSGPA